MADLALLDLYDRVEARFTSEATPCTLLFGWDESPKQLRGPRIVMVPGDDGATAFNGALPVRQPGRNPRPLGNLAELFHVVVSASDTATPENDRAQYTACRLLFDAWYRAANLAVGIRMVFISASWLVERTVRRAGAALVATFTIEAMIPDSALLETDFQARGLFDAFMLDAEQQFQTEAAYPDAAAVAVANITRSGTQTIDGVALGDGDRVLLTGQTLPAQNGLYTVAAGAWARTADTLVADMLVTVSGGSLSPSLYRLDTAGTITPDTTPQTWGRITPA